MTDETKKTPRWRNLLAYGAVFATVVATWYLLTTQWVVGTRAPADAGQFGDSFGAVNALFSGLAFASLVLALWLQRLELELQRKELRDTRKEFERQNATLAAQRFENTFFQLIKTHGDIVQSMSIDSHVGVRGIAAFGLHRDVFNDLYSWHTPGEIGALEESYERFYRAAEPHLAHYFRHLYHIVDFVDKSGIDNPLRYCKFLRAQLSSREQVLLFYNCLSKMGRDQFKPLIEKYAFFQTLNVENLVFPGADIGLYAAEAFGNNRTYAARSGVTTVSQLTEASAPKPADTPRPQ